MNNWPKILIVSGYEILEAPDATSITIRSLLKDWPQDRLCEIYCGMYENDALISPQRSNRLNLSVNDVKHGDLLSKLRTEKTKVQKDNQINELVLVTTQNLKERIKQKLKFLFSATADMFPYQTRKLHRFITAHNPDVVYVIPYGKRILDLTLYLQKTYDIPVITHLMDDWPTTIYRDSSTTLLQRKLTLRQFNTLMTASKSVFVISDAMKKEYEQRYPRVRFSVFMNSPQIELKPVSIAPEVKKVVCIGSLHLNRWQSLLEFCRTISDHKLNLTIDIYSADWSRLKHHFTEFSFVQSKEVLLPEQMNSALEGYDALLFLESFDPGVRQYTRFSVSTKIPEYLGAQKPIIAIGPSDIASILYLKKNKAAYVLDETNLAQWNDILSISLNDQSHLETTLHHAKDLFRRNHNADTIRADFFKAVQNVI